MSLPLVLLLFGAIILIGALGALLANGQDRELRGVLREVLEDHAVTDPINQGLHNWRCQYPESYGRGPCDCVDKLLDDLVAAVRTFG